MMNSDQQQTSFMMPSQLPPNASLGLAPVNPNKQPYNTSQQQQMPRPSSRGVGGGGDPFSSSMPNGQAMSANNSSSSSGFFRPPTMPTTNASAEDPLNSKSEKILREIKSMPMVEALTGIGATPRIPLESNFSFNSQEKNPYKYAPLQLSALPPPPILPMIQPITKTPTKPKDRVPYTSQKS